MMLELKCVADFDEWVNGQRFTGPEVTTVLFADCEDKNYSLHIETDYSASGDVYRVKLEEEDRLREWLMRRHVKRTLDKFGPLY